MFLCKIELCWSINNICRFMKLPIMDALLKQTEQGIKRLDVNDVDHRVDRAVVEKKIADCFNAKGIVYKKGSDRFTPEHWNQLNELAEKHQKLPEHELIPIVKKFLQENGYTFHDVRQTLKENKADLPSGPKRDGRSFAGAVPALLAIAFNALHQAKFITLYKQRLHLFALSQAPTSQQG